MINSRLELPSAHGDQTLPAVRFVLFGARREAQPDIMTHGLRFAPGEAVVGTNLVHVQAQMAGQAGTVVVLAVPAELHLGYAAQTTAYIDRSLKVVEGSPLRYAAGRQLLSFYLDADTEVARKQIEQPAHELGAAGPGLSIDVHYVLGAFAADSALASTIGALQQSAQAFEAVDIQRTERALVELFDCREPAQAVLVPSMAHSLVVGTMESLILTRLRMMRWQGLSLLGYRFIEDRQDVAVTRVADVAEQRRRMDEYGRLLASSALFSGELAWLKTYALHELDLMRVELDAAELDVAGN